MKIYDYNGKKNICGERIHTARRKLKITQSDLAARIQIEGIIIERDSISAFIRIEPSGLLGPVKLIETV